MIPVASDYGSAWITGRTKHGRVIHTVLKRRDSGLSLTRTPAHCGRRLVFFIVSEAVLKERMLKYPLCEKCDEWMQ